MEDCGFLKFTDESLKGNFLQTMSTMRKHRLFCDIILNVSFFICKIKTQKPLVPKPPKFKIIFGKNRKKKQTNKCNNRKRIKKKKQ